MTVDDRVMGAFVMIGSFVVLALYGVCVIFSEYGLLVVKWTAFLAVTGALAITAWIGYTLATTPSPEPLEFSMDESEGEAEPED